MTTPLFTDARPVLVVGDAMLDRYHQGSTTRISPEAPVPVLHVRQSFDRPGGAANVALNVAALGVPVTLICLVGDDRDAEILRDLLQARGVDCRFVTAPGACTIVKMRALSHGQQIMRVDFEERFAPDTQEAVAAAFADALPDHGTVVLSDYGKGTLAGVAGLIAQARDTPVLVDPKGDDFTRYAGATLLTPNEREFLHVAGPAADEEAFAAKGRAMRRTLGLAALLVTRSERGMTLIDGDDRVTSIATRAREVYDVTGAGDTVIATLAAAISSGRPVAEAMAIANQAAGIVVSRHGTATVTASELLASLTHERLDLPEEDVLAEIAAARERGQRIVMTNGCFDVLHAGHVSYLGRARALGDRLLVAVNSDASVRRLKGAERPFNALEHRTAVLRGLRAVDWVIGFDGSVAADGTRSDTPLDLIRRVRPDVLVKGGDYAPDTIVGAADVRGWGGTVEVVSFVEGQSTTNLAERIRAGKENGQ